MTSNAVEVNGPLTLTGDSGLIEIIGYGSAIDGYDGINVAGNSMTIQSLVTDETAQDGKNHEFYAITQNRDNAIEISGDGNQIIAKGTSTSGTYGIYETSTRTSAKVIVSGNNNAITADATTQGSYGRSGTAVGIGTRYASVEVTGNGTQITADYVRLDGNASNVCGIYTDHDSASITISGNDTKISVSSQATNAPTTGIQANKASAITVTGNGTEITIDVNDANVAKAMGIVTGSVNGFYGGSITVGSFADDGSVTAWNDLKISITGNAAVEKGLYTAKGSISIALDAEGSISAATAIEANNLLVFNKGTIDGNVTSLGSDADKVTLLDGGSITGDVDLGAGDDLFAMDIDSLLDGTLSNAEIVDITGFDNLAGTSGSVGLIAGIGSMTDGFQLDGFEAELGVAQQVSDTLWAKLSNDDGSLVVSWGESEESVSAAFDAFNNNTTQDFGAAMVSTDGTSFSDLSREEFSNKKSKGTLA